MNEQPDIAVLPFNSTLQLQSIVLRQEILRTPLGLKFTDEELETEHDQIHIGAILRGTVIGILLLKKMSDSVLKMRQVAVLPEFQNIGLGKKLVAFAEAWAVARDYTTIELHARENAVPFYNNLGYSVDGNSFEEVGITHYKMLKKLIY
jgi:predicted GNAT family N-acyltransferase